MDQNQGDSISKTNRNCKFNGVVGNARSIFHNINCNFEGRNNNINFSHCTNVKFLGSDNTVSGSNENNLKFNGDSNNCILKSNTNLQINGNNNRTELNSNTNGRIDGDSNYVNASNNTNFKVEGNFHKVISAIGTVSHHLRTERLNTTKNTVTVCKSDENSLTRDTNGSFWSRLSPFGGPTNGEGSWNSFKFMIDYVREIKINRAEYKIGIFEFKMKQTEATTVEATFDSSKYDGRMLETSEESNKVILTGSKNGKKESLEFIAPRITLSRNHDITLLHISDTNSKL